MRYLHTMLRVRDLDAALDFFCSKLGLEEVRRRVDEKNRYTLVFLAAPDDEGLVKESKRSKGRDAPLVELTYNWDTEDYGEARYFGHLAYEVPASGEGADGTLILLLGAERTSVRTSRLTRGWGGHFRRAAQPAMLRRCGARLPAPVNAIISRRPPLRPSSSGPGHRPFTAGTRVRVP